MKAVGGDTRSILQDLPGEGVDRFQTLIALLLEEARRVEARRCETLASNALLRDELRRLSPPSSHVFGPSELSSIISKELENTINVEAPGHEGVRFCNAMSSTSLGSEDSIISPKTPKSTHLFFSAIK